MKPVLVTGATGFLGGHLTRSLIQGGKRVRVLCRGAWEGDPAVEAVRGDVTVAPDVDRAVEGVECVYHLAGVVSREPKDAVMLHGVHVEGSRNVFESVIRHQSGRVVVSSSSGTIAVSDEPVVHDETEGYKEREVQRWPYYTSKIEQEKLAIDYCHSRGLDVVVINPSLLLGPGDARGSSTGDIAAFLKGQIFSFPTGGMNFVDARDAASGAILAMERGARGERYLLGGVNWTVRQLIRAVARIAGLPAPKLTSPTWLSLATAPLLRRVLPWTGRKFDLDNATIAMAGMFWYCDSSKARRELGFQSREPLETLRATVEDLRARGTPR